VFVYVERKVILSIYLFISYYTFQHIQTRPKPLDTERVTLQACLLLFGTRISATFPISKFKPVTEREIYEVNKNPKWKDYCGYDEVPSKIVKLSMPFISSFLIHICNRMLFTGTFPTHFKFSQILPIFKKGIRVEISAYRPISLLTSFSKIFENVIIIDCFNILKEVI
jgi:Notch-like protein